MLRLGCLVLLTLRCAAAPADPPPAGPCGQPMRETEIEIQESSYRESYPPGTQILFNCRPGYSRLGAIKKVCTNGRWERLPGGGCNKRSCGHPGDLQFGSFELEEGEGFVFGAVVKYSCDDGYQMVSKQVTRECTASGWSHHTPFCEVRKCPPIQAPDNVNVISSSYDDDGFSVGQVVKFECKSASLKLEGLSEIFCTSAGTWSADPPVCKEISCTAPTISNGNVQNPKRKYNEHEQLQFQCDPKYKPSKSADVLCTKNGWSPEPFCEEISCYPQYVANGKVVKTKEVYKVGETIVLVCDYGYRIETSPDEPRRCTKNDWSPPLTCISLTCDRPYIDNGDVYGGDWYYSFPRRTNSEIEYRCKDGYLTAGKVYNEKTRCTANGWSPKPKCTRSCYGSDAAVTNGRLGKSEWVYLSGENVDFTCNQGYLTPQGKNHGERECLPNGGFTEAKCSRYCALNQLTNGNYEPKKDLFEVGENLLIQCNNGYMTRNRNLQENIQCLSQGWNINPQCIEVTCSLDRNSLLQSDKVKYKANEVARFSCPKGYILAGDESSQCYYYGWGPKLPTCKDAKCFVTSDFLIPSRKEYSEGEEITFSCSKGHRLIGESRVRCYHDGWYPRTLTPSCEVEHPGDGKQIVDPETLPEKPGGEGAKFCQIENPRLILSPHQQKYNFKETVDFSCPEEFHRVGPNSSTCTKDGWKPALPTCEAENPALPDPEDKTSTEKPDSRQKCPPVSGPVFSQIISTKSEYYSGDEVEIQCTQGYSLHGDHVTRCVDGKWQSSAQCIQKQRCGNPPSIADGIINRDTLKLEHFTGDTVKYICNPGYSFLGSDGTQCTGGTWLAPPQCAANSCGNPPAVVKGNLIRKKEAYSHGDSAEYKCVQGYKLSDESPAKCLEGEWSHVPTCDSTSCLPPPSIDNGSPNSRLKAEYASGDKVKYACNRGYNLEKKISEAVCEETRWKSIPVCRKTGSTCSTPPTIAHGDFLGLIQQHYRSGFQMEYKCPEYYTLQGNRIVKCMDGVWDEPPVCLEPCTAKEKELKENNIVFKWTDANKLYSKHDDSMEFICVAGYEIANRSLLRLKCNMGEIPYPKCNKIGSCLLSEETMKNQNIYITRSSAIQDGEKVTFECNKGMIPEKTLEGTCKMKVLNYPRCITANKCKSAPDVPNGRVKADHLKQDGYDAGSSVEFECDEHHGISGPINVKCENGQWSDLPQCLKPCRISQKDLNANHVELISRDDEKKVFKDGEEVDVKCKAGSKSPFGGIERKGECSDGKLRNIRCFEGDFCRINQNEIDKRNLELDLTRNSDGYYADGEDVHFVCKEGFNVTGSLDGKCEKKDLTYPLCAPPGNCDQNVEEQVGFLLHD
uniref:Sushi domain-containing protein n=1 Tax=Leptobrachium leishanense TaxID=445787 RepID=A0A8C5R8N2_9ANUR